jgi:Putative amidoligase enzyme
MISRPHTVIQSIQNTTTKNGSSPKMDPLNARNFRAVSHPDIAEVSFLETNATFLVAMEIVSPVLNTRTSNITNVLSEFWEAMGIHFDVRKAPSCGGHVHVTPPTANSHFTLSDLKTIAFAIVISEDFVHAILPPVRRTNKYCAMNTRSDCGVKQLVRVGKSSVSFASVNAAIKNIGSERDLCLFMQKNRYVLWNFQNTFPQNNGRCSGTLEFRGGSQFLTAKGSLRWIAFVVSFITLALEEV